MLNVITRIADAVRPAPREKTLQRALLGSIVHVRRPTELAFVGTVVSPSTPLVLLASIKPGQRTAIVRWEGRGNYDVDVAALSPSVEFPGFEEARRLIARREAPSQLVGAGTLRTITEYITEEPERR